MPGGISIDDESSSHMLEGSNEFASETPTVMEPEPISPEVQAQDGSSVAGPVSEEPRDMTQDATGPADTSVTQQAKRRIAPPEQLIIVQPALKRQHHHPYNLQIQLLGRSRTGSNPNSENGHGTRSRSNSGASSRVSIDLARSNSFSSSRSGGSDVSAGSSSGNTTRRAIPLYNLDFHHIRTTNIIDAGTDQNVAKFTRKGVEIDGFGLLQPQEVLYRPNENINVPTQSRTLTDLEEPRRSFESAGIADGTPEKMTGLGASEEPNKVLRNKFFTRIRKFGKNLRGNTIAEDKTMPGRSQSFLNLPRSGTISTMEPLRPNEAQQDTLQSGAISPPGQVYGNTNAIAQLTPGAGIANGKTTKAYTWEIKRWNRDESPHFPQFLNTETNPILARIWKQFNHFSREGHRIAAPPAHAIAPHFEWVRDYEWPPSPTGFTSQPAEPVSKPAVAITDTETSAAPDAALVSVQPGSAERTSPTRCPSDSSEAGSELQYTSWTCFLVLDEATRIPMGQLKPAPHHPLVVCQLSLPSPLPDLRHSGLGQDGRGFSREELRDIVVVTSVHLVIRESLGSLQGTP